ncbi:hypothetical protein EYF80_000810 [Liparis tanakae]|uniref:Uncharacterized protein n=1 Tax=Liparis tanakae TaxID=230148 RepID=A0A4Z2JI40_9TELE|nr:hypothetical protein EYF80_000810 [Liparis tanakae]
MPNTRKTNRQTNRHILRVGNECCTTTEGKRINRVVGQSTRGREQESPEECPVMIILSHDRAAEQLSLPYLDCPSQVLPSVSQLVEEEEEGRGGGSGNGGGMEGEGLGGCSTRRAPTSRSLQISLPDSLTLADWTVWWLDRSKGNTQWLRKGS